MSMTLSNKNTFLIVIFLKLFTRTESTSLCSPLTGLNITNGDKLQNGSIRLNDLTFEKKDYYESEGTIWGCPCNLKKCIRKYCKENEFYDFSSGTCNSSMVVEFSPFGNETLDNFTIIYKKGCQEGKDEVVFSEDFQLQQNGTLLADGNNREPKDYCLENDETGKMFAVSCEFLEPDKSTMRHLHAIGMIISMPFLLATFLAYLALPDRRLHQKALMCYVINLLLAYILLVNIQLSQTHIAIGPCKFLGFGTLFCFMSSFFWMNVICIDIWSTFRIIKGFVGSRKDSKRRFIYSLIYACGIPFVHTMIVVFLNEYVDPKESYFPGITASNCFLGKNQPQLLYFYWLVAVLIATNIIMFSLTALNIKKHEQETSFLKGQDSKRHVHEHDKQKFNLYLKFLFIMGVNWSTEFISFVVNWADEGVPDELWYFTDFCNAIYGVFIFFIFVFNKKMWRAVQKRYYTLIGKPHLAPSLTATSTTQSSVSSIRKP